MCTQPLPKLEVVAQRICDDHTLSKIHAWNLSLYFSLVTSNIGCFLNYDIIFLLPIPTISLGELWILPMSFRFCIFAICFSLNFPQWLNKRDKQKGKASWKVSWGPAIAAFSFVWGLWGVPASGPVHQWLWWWADTQMTGYSHCLIPS